MFWAPFVCLPKIKFLLKCTKVVQRPEGYIQTKEKESFKGQNEFIQAKDLLIHLGVARSHFRIESF